MMKIQCEKCGTNYRVAKEKIANRTVRVHCQRCRTEMVIVGPPASQPNSPPAKPSGGRPPARPTNRQLNRHLKLEARRLRQGRRRTFFRMLGKGITSLFILLIVGLGSYFMATTPGIPKAYAVAFVAINGLFWGAFAARDRWNRNPDAPA
jgi:predicted Zn finger-like uncharacterized protein